MSVQFLDALPGVTRTSGTSRYAALLPELDSNPNSFGFIEGPVANGAHYNTATNLNSGKVAGVDPENYEFVARSLTAEQAKQFGLPEPEPQVKEDGSPVLDKEGNQVIADGYVFGRKIEGETQAEVLAARAERKAKAAATRAKNGTTPGRPKGKAEGKPGK